MPLSRSSLRSAAANRLGGPGARLLSRLGVTPNGVTLMGLALSLVSAVVIATGYLAVGGAVLLVSATLDMMDGVLARLTGRASDAGALLDSVADRVAEASVLLGVLVFALARGDTTLAVLVNLAIVTSVLVSYIRARAEGLGVRETVGFMTRPERVVVLAIGLLSGFPTVALGIIAAGSTATAVHRFLHAWKQLRRDHDRNE